MKNVQLQNNLSDFVKITNQPEHQTGQFSANHKNYNFLNCDWFIKLLFPTNSLVRPCQVVIGQFGIEQLVIGQFVIGSTAQQANFIQSCSSTNHI